MASSENKLILEVQEMLGADKHQGLRTSIYSAFLEDEQRGANMIVSFAAEKGITLSTQDVINQLNSFDDDDVDVELTPEMLANVAGGVEKCP
jgi:hypothetical protein